jgi:hypothetical protein
MGLLAAFMELLVRPPCPPGAVRFIDLAPIMPVVPAIGVVAGVLGFLRARRPGRHLVLASLGSMSVVVALLFVLGVVAGILANVGAEYDSSCWSF